MNALSKAAIVDVLCEELNFTRPDAKNLVENFFEVLKSTLEHGKDVKLSGFGNFILRDKAERPGRNPKTGEAVPVGARRVVTFKPGLKLRAKIDKKPLPLETKG
ncbi:MAG: integration host factor subunit alpha [Legionella sp.]|nr:integration host factor subunit alpha [Legionella sp.]